MLTNIEKMVTSCIFIVKHLKKNIPRVFSLMIYFIKTIYLIDYLYYFFFIDRSHFWQFK